MNTSLGFLVFEKRYDMQENLVIVESPAKAKTIGKYLGPDYVVKASMGHLRDLPKSTLGVDVEGDFTPNYRPIKGKEDIIKDLKTTADKSKTVYLATDPDREGEAISWHLQHLLDLPDDKARRVTFNEITKKDYEESNNPLQVFEEVFDVIKDRKVHPKEGSYTNYLFDKGIDKILKKLGEEATEIVIAAKNPNPNEVKYEISDFLYHMMVLMAEKDVTWEEITTELANR